MTWSGPADFLGWAKRPKSDTAAREILRRAASDRRFAAIARVLLEQGVLSRTGQLLLRPDGSPADRAG